MAPFKKNLQLNFLYFPYRLISSILICQRHSFGLEHRVRLVFFYNSSFLTSSVCRSSLSSSILFLPAVLNLLVPPWSSSDPATGP